MTTVDPGSAQSLADRIRDRRAAEGTLGKPQPVTGGCWRSECRSGCYYPDVCSEKTSATVAPAVSKGAAR